MKSSAVSYNLTLIEPNINIQQLKIEFLTLLLVLSHPTKKTPAKAESSTIFD